MNDLNSVYIVGKVKSNGKKNGLVITNNSYVYDEKKKEYKAEKQDFHILLTDDNVVLKKGMRIGVNGRLKNVSGFTCIISYSLVIL
jgi:hypothetical protein